MIQQIQQQYKLFDQFKVIKTIGRGTYGKILLVQNIQKQLYALKIADKFALKKYQRDRIYFNAEVQYLNQIKNRNIIFQRSINFYGVFQDQQQIGLLFQYCEGGDLLNHQAKLPQKVFKLEQATKIIAETLMALEQLQYFGYTHGDLKSQNIYFANKGDSSVIKLKDFGYPSQVQFFKSNSSNYDLAPNISSRSPQSLARAAIQQYCGQKFKKDFFNIQKSEQDVWSLGVLLYFMLNMEFPSKNNLWNLQNTLIKLKQLTKNFSYKDSVNKSKKKKFQNCNELTQDFFKRVFQFDIQTRITLNQIKMHPLFAKYFFNNSNIYSITINKLNQENFLELKKKLQILSFQNQMLKKEVDSLKNYKKQVISLKAQNQELKMNKQQAKKLSQQIKNLLNEPN